MEKYYSTHEVAELCQVSRGSVIRWIREKKLPSAVTAGGHNRIRATDLMKLLIELRMEIPKELPTGFNPQKKNNILIVDDELLFCKMLRKFFEQTFPDFGIEEAHDGFEAGLKFQEFKPQLVILDLMLPGIDGFRVCQQVRKSSKEVRIIAVSGHSGTDMREKILQLGADIFLAKPFQLSVLQKVVCEILNLPFRLPSNDTERNLKAS